MKITEEEYIEYLELLDEMEPEKLEEGFNKIIQEKKCKFRDPNTLLVMRELLTPVWDPKKDQLYFDLADVRVFVESENGKREDVEIV